MSSDYERKSDFLYSILSRRMRLYPFKIENKSLSIHNREYGVASASRIDEIVGLFFKRAL